MCSCFTWYRWHQGLPSPLLLLPPFLAATRSPAISSPGSTLRPGVTWYSATSSKLPLPMLLACPVQLVRETLSEQPPLTRSLSSNPAPSIWLTVWQGTETHLTKTHLKISRINLNLNRSQGGSCLLKGRVKEGVHLGFNLPQSNKQISPGLFLCCLPR